MQLGENWVGTEMHIEDGVATRTNGPLPKLHTESRLAIGMKTKLRTQLRVERGLATGMKNKNTCSDCESRVGLQLGQL